jgi:hypothetical protein
MTHHLKITLKEIKIKNKTFFLSQSIVLYSYETIHGRVLRVLQL